MVCLFVCPNKLGAWGGYFGICFALGFVFVCLFAWTCSLVGWLCFFSGFLLLFFFSLPVCMAVAPMQFFFSCPGT